MKGSDEELYQVDMLLKISSRVNVKAIRAPGMMMWQIEAEDYLWIITSGKTPAFFKACPHAVATRKTRLRLRKTFIPIVLSLFKIKGI